MLFYNVYNLLLMAHEPQCDLGRQAKEQCNAPGPTAHSHWACFKQLKGFVLLHYPRPNLCMHYVST